MAAMIHPDRALELVLDFPSSPRTERIPIRDAVGRVMPGRLLSPLDAPPFDKSAMDGFACRKDDPAEGLRIVETIAAGSVPERPIGRGECARIMTGAMLPEGADTVVRVERCRVTGERLSYDPEPVDNIIRQGENIRAGDPLLGPRLLRAQDIGVLASSGIAEIDVSVPPRVGIVSTGTELRLPGEPLGPGQIYDSNGPQLAAQASELRCPAFLAGSVPDDEQATVGMIGRALEECDVLLLSGGVSMGEFDYVPRALERNGVKPVFHSVAIKPGKPLWFGRKGAKAVFGLPGNPVSVFVLFELFVRPYLSRWMGLDRIPREERCELGTEIRRRPGDRIEIVPVRREGRRVFPIRYGGSSHLTALAEADGLLRISAETERIAEGTVLNVRPIR